MYRCIKGIALLLPTIIGCALLVVVLLKFSGTMTDVQVLEAKMDSLIGIIGVAVSVWIGLNIYNVAERKEIESLRAEIKNIGEAAERYKRIQEHLSNQIQISGTTLFLQTKMIEQRNWLKTERPLVLGSEFSYIDYIEGFVLRFEEYAKENKRLEFPHTINWHDLYHDFSESLTFFITERWRVHDRIIGVEDIIHINKIMDKIDTLFESELFSRLDIESFKNDMSVLRSMNHNTIHFLDDIKGDEILIIKDHLQKQEEIINKMLRPL